MPPDWNRYVRSHLPSLGLRPEREEEIAAEIAEQLEDAYQEALRSGSSEEEARAAAESHVKDWDKLAEELRDSNRETRAVTGTGFWHDVRYALRGMRKNPTFAWIAMITLAFGIGGNTAIFTVVDHIALRGLPYPDSARLIDIEHVKADQPEIDPWCSLDNLKDFQHRSQAFESIAAISPVWSLILSDRQTTERLEALYVSPEFFPMLRVSPLHGRLLTASDKNTAVLSYGFWQRHFGGSPDAIGRTLNLDGGAATVVGVLPQDFRWRGEPLSGTAIQPELWLPLTANQLARSPRTLRFLKVTGRLKPGITTLQGQDEIRRIGDALTSEFPDANKNLMFRGVPLEKKITGRLRPAVYLLLATVGFVLLMASANVANLLLAQAALRRREVAVRIALGASGWRLFRQFLTESVVLASAASVMGVALAYGFLRLIVAYGPAAMLQALPISIDSRALLFTTGVSTLTAMLAGIAPAWRAIAGQTGTALREGRGTTQGSHRVRSALAVAQVTIALVLMIGSGLLIRSFLRVLSIDPGFDAAKVVSVTTQVPPNANRTQVYETIRNALLALPGVEKVAAVSRLPMLGQNLASLLVIEGREQDGHPPEVEFRAATPGYFDTMGIPLKSGRDFNEHDPASLSVLIIDDLTAHRYFPGVDPIGKRVRFLADRNGPWFTIIGVAGATRHFGLEADPRPTIYRPAVINPLGSPIFVIRTASKNLDQFAHIVRTAYGGMPAYNVFAMDQLVDRSTEQRRFLMWLLTAFAISALLLAAVGLYGAVSQTVLQRRQEIGVRIALGATPIDTLKLVFGEGLRIAALGAVLGVALAYAAAKFGETLLYGVRPGDVVVFTAGVVTLILSDLLACYLPARRALKVDPLVTLRDE